MKDLFKRIFGSRKRENKRRERKLIEGLIESTNTSENILGVWMDIKNLKGDVRLYFLIIAIQFFLTSVIIFILLMVV